MAGTVEKIRRERAAKLEAYRAAYDGFVVRLAEEEPVAPDDVRETLEALGLTIDRLDADVADRQRRLRLADEANEGPALRRQLDEAVSAVEAAKREAAESAWKHGEAVNSLVAARDALATRADNAEVARLALQKLFLADMPAGSSAADVANRSSAFRQEVARRRA